MNKKTKKILKNILSVFMAVLLCLGAFPISAVTALAASYNVHTSADLTNTAHQQEADNAALIGNLSKYRVDLTNGNFIIGEEPWAQGYNIRHTVMLPVSKIPQSASETKVYEDVCKIRYTDAGRLPNGTEFDIEYTLKKVTLQGTTNSYNSEMKYVEVAAGSVDGVLSGCYAHKSDYSAFTAITPYGKNEWTVKVIPKDGSIEGNFKLPQLFEDVDILVQNPGPYAESIELVSGFGSNTWVQSGTQLEISNNGSRYSATVAGVNTPSHDPSVAFLAIANNKEYKLNWYGLGCRTYITPKSALGVYSSVTKSVKEKLVNIGSSVHYSILADTSYTNEQTQKQVVKVIDVLDKVLDAETAKVTVLNPKGNDVTKYWTVSIGETNKQQLIIQPNKPADMNGAYTVNISAKVREDADFTGYEKRMDGETTYYTVPNYARLCIKYVFGLFTDDKSNEVIFEVPVTPEHKVSKIQLDKDVDQEKLVGAKAGDSLAYTFKITNTGESVLSNVHIDDELKGVSKIEYDWSGVKSGTNVMEPDEVATAKATYAITQEDIDNGQVINNAVVTGTDEENADVTDDDDAETVIEENPSIKIEKEVDKTEIDNAKAGDQLTYTFTATNTGNVTLTKCKFTDDLSIEGLKWDSKIATMAPGQAISGTATYTLTQADIDSGKVVNNCTIGGTSPAGKTVTDKDDAKTTITVGTASIKHTKSTEKAVLDVQESIAGHVVPFNFTIENNCNVTLHDIRLEDHLEGVYDVAIDWSGAKTEGSLLPGESVPAKAFYALTQADIDAGKVVNTSTAYGVDPQGNEVSADAEASVELTQMKNSSIALEKEVDQKKLVGAKAGDVLNYTFKITNGGETTLKDVYIEDVLQGISEIAYDWSGVKSVTNVMEPGEIATATAAYQLRQADIDAGEVINNALVTGTDDYGNNVTDEDDAKTTIEEAPSITIEKKVDQTTIENAKAGDVLTYTFVATNSGNVTLNRCQFTDDLPIEGLTWEGDISTLPPGQAISGTATYTLTQTDIDNAAIENFCTIEGTSPAGQTVTDTSNAETTIVNGIASIKHTKSTAEGILDINASVVGHIIPFDFTIENNCNVTLHDIRLEDHLEGIYDVVIDWTGVQSEGFLLPGESVPAKAFYALTQADIDAGKVVNTSTAYGVDPQDNEVSADAEATVKITANPQVELEKDVDISKLEEQIPQTAQDDAQTSEIVVDNHTISNAFVGMEIPYTFVGTNNGNKTLVNVKIVDEMEGLSEIAYVWPGEEGVLEPGQVVMATATYKLTQADLDAANVKNEAVIKGTTLEGDPVDDPGDTTTEITQHPGLSVIKTTEVTKIDDAVAGETVIPYSFVIGNTGDVTLHDVLATDDHDILDLTWEKDISVLEVGEQVKGTGTYTITQDDIKAGHVLNTILVTGKSPQDVEVTDEDDVDTEIVKKASLLLEKTVDTTKISNAKPGDLVSYEIKSRNNGNLVIKDIVLSDSLTGKGLSELEFAWPAEAGILLPGQTLIAKATYKVTQTDIDAGKVINTAHIEGTPDDPENPGDPVIPEDSTVTTDLEQDSAIKVTKEVDISEIRNAKAGDEVHYTITGENIGNVTLKNVKLTDQLDGIKNLKLKWDNAEGTLLPGEKVTATATYAITADDIAKGSIENVVIITGEDPTDEPHEDEDKVKSLIPSITTAASDAADGDKNVIAATASGIKDKITFKDFETKSLTIVSTVYDKATKSILKVNGQAVTAEKKVVLNDSSGEAEIEISFNGTGLGGKTLSVVTQVYETGTNKLIYEHNKDLSDDAESVAMTGDSTTTITGEKMVTTTPRQATVTTRSSNSGSPQASSTTPSTTTAASVKTGDDNTTRNALIVMVVAGAAIAGCVLYLKKRRTSK